MGKKKSSKKKLENTPRLKQDNKFQNSTGLLGIQMLWVKKGPHPYSFEILGYYILRLIEKHVEPHMGNFQGEKKPLRL